MWDLDVSAQHEVKYPDRSLHYQVITTSLSDATGRDVNFDIEVSGLVCRRLMALPSILEKYPILDPCRDIDVEGLIHAMEAVIRDFFAVFGDDDPGTVTLRTVCLDLHHAKGSLTVLRHDTASSAGLTRFGFDTGHDLLSAILDRFFDPEKPLLKGDGDTRPDVFARLGLLALRTGRAESSSKHASEQIAQIYTTEVDL